MTLIDKLVYNYKCRFRATPNTVKHVSKIDKLEKWANSIASPSKADRTYGLKIWIFQSECQKSIISKADTCIRQPLISVPWFSALHRSHCKNIRTYLDVITFEIPVFPIERDHREYTVLVLRVCSVIEIQTVLR